MTNNEPSKVASTPFYGPLIFLITLLFLLAVVKLVAGSESIPVKEIFTVLTGGEPSDSTWKTIILVVRLPRLVTALLAGAALGISGLAMQTLFRNPLAEPYVLGISSGSTLGVACFMLITNIAILAPIVDALPSLPNASTVIASAIGAAAVFGLILVVSNYVRNNMTLLILGMLVGYTASSMVTILLQFSSPEDTQRFVHWGFGSFGGVSWEQMRVFFPAILLGLLVLGLSGKALNALLLGENYARSMGQNVFVSRIIIICGSSVLAGTVTAYCGPIAFMGIAVPHLTRALFKTSDHRILLPMVILLGALLACFADILAQLPGTAITLPLNAVSALIGAPIIIAVILRRRNMGGDF